jgi:(R)-citramalate synthase
MRVEIMDTTLRDGEQTSGVSFTEKEKFTIAKQLLVEVKVDRIEIASARVSEGEFVAVEKIINWARENGFIERIEVLGFVDGKNSIEWMHKAGAKCLNLLSKGSLNHLENQLKKTPEEHFSDIKFSVDYASDLGIDVNIYLEDWSNGMINSPDYVFQLLDYVSKLNIKRFMLPDTLGILAPKQVYEFCKSIIARFPNLHFDFHGHNDYDLAVANSLAAVSAGCKGLHTSINGLGERTGNTPLSSIVPAILDHVKDAELSVQESKLNKISKLVELASGIRVPVNIPIIGENVFTQTAGVHADGDSKGNLYFSKLMPERFGRVRKYALGKTSGKANIKKNLEELGLELDAETIAKVTDKVIELGDKKENITTEDLPYIISEVLGNKVKDEKIKLINYYLCKSKGLKPVANVSIKIYDTEYQQSSVGDGMYDAFVSAIRKIYDIRKIELPTLIDYEVTIPPGGKTNALVETAVTWQKDNWIFKTRGLDPDQSAAAITATIRMLNIIEEKAIGR